MIFFFGDTISKNPSVVNYHAADPIAWSTSTDPEAGLLLNFYTVSDGSPLFVKAPGITMGPDDIPTQASASTARSTSFATRFRYQSGQSASGDYSVLVQFTRRRRPSPRANHLPSRRTIHRRLGARFRIVRVHFGAGPYRASDIYLQRVPASSFASGAGTEYFAVL